MNILHLTTIIPSPMQHKIIANDILIRLASAYEKAYPDDKNVFILVLPYSNCLLARFKPKWKEYYQLQKAGNYELNGYRIYVLGIPAFKSDIKWRRTLVNLGYLLNRKRINAIMKSCKPDMLHAHNMRNNMELAELFKRKFHCEFVLTARDVNEYSLCRIKNGFVNPKYIISINQVSRDKCLAYLNKQVQMIPHPVDQEFFIENPMIKDASEKVAFVSVCKLFKLKNLDKVLKALADIRQPFSYTIIGDGPEKDNLIKLTNELRLTDNVKFSGNVTHEVVQHNLKGFDVFIMPSYPETLGRAFLEALASGLPVIAAKNTGVDGIISHGQHGFLVDHVNIREIHDSIQALMNLSTIEKLQMKKNAVQLARNFTWEITLEKYYHLYHS